MSKTRKAPVSVAALVGAVENGCVCETAQPSANDSTISAADRQFQISDLLLHGAENGQTITDLERLTGWRSREIRKQIERERRNGALILSNNRDGYYLASDLVEVQQFTRSMLHRSREIAKTARILERVAGLD